MTRIKLDCINTKQLNIENGSVIIKNNTPSINSFTGSLVLNGGIGIMSTSDAVSCTNGGSVTINGGVGIKKQLYLGNN